MKSRCPTTALSVLLWSSLCLAAASSFSKPHPNSKLRVRQVLVVHRHGDRTPITPMKDETYWAATLPEPHVLDGIARGTTLLRPPEGGPKKHGAAGRGPFGQLSMRGVLQMVSLGERLKEELDHSLHTDDDDDDDESQFVNRGRLFTPDRPLHPSRVKVMSTDFPRTVQSVQALLTGLFPDVVHDDSPIEIDLQHTNTYFIPDPHPRQSIEQVRLESHLSKRPHLLEKEGTMRELAHRVTDALEGHLGEGAKGVSFGIGEEKDASQASTTRQQPLSWPQLSEILVCLHSRELLPPVLSEKDVEAVSNHVAWRWFENLRHPVLAKSAMWKFASRLVDNMQRKVEEHEASGSTELTADEVYEQDCIEEPLLCIYSAHDSTLIGLLCVLQLEQPAEWPEYGSALKVELILEEENGSNNRHWVRFSLNGQTLRSTWLTDDDGEPASIVPLNELADMIHSEHELFDDHEEGSGLKYTWRNGLLKEH